MAAPTESVAHSLSPTLTSDHKEEEEKVGAEAAGAAPAAETPNVVGFDPAAILTGKKLAVVFVAMLLALLLVALDQSKSAEGPRPPEPSLRLRLRARR